MRIVYFGTPQFAAPTLAALITSRHDVAAVVTQPDRARGRGQEVSFAPVKALAASHGLTVLQPEKLKAPEFVEALAGVRADIGVVAAYGRLLPQALLDLPPRGMVNVHASLLPRWRGAAPIHRAIQAGDTATGVTIMRVVLALDAGPMLSRVEVPIDEDISSSALEARLADAGARLLVATLDQLETGAVTETPQDESRVTYAARLDRRDSRIDWTRPARDIHNQIRAMHPWPLTSVLWRGKRLILRRSSFPQKGSDPFSTDFAVLGTGLAPGTIVGVGERLLVQAGDQPLSITEVQLDGRRPQSAREVINGSRPLVGDLFEPLSLS
jgi:methionyl-tRNA formyltransferase